MFIDLTPEQRALQAELREYFSTLITPEEAAAMESDRHNEAYRTVIKRMGSDGKLGVGWPKEYGGLGFGPVEQQIFINEANRADIPLPMVTLQTVGPTLQALGTEEQKKKFLPGILAGEVHFAIGYSEPDAGTDLASLRGPPAVRHGDEYIVNGQKMWTTGAHDADYIWLACRTDPTAAKHKGISILIVDTKDPRLLLDPDHPVRRRASTPTRRTTTMCTCPPTCSWVRRTAAGSSSPPSSTTSASVSGRPAASPASTTRCTPGHRSQVRTVSPRSSRTP